MESLLRTRVAMFGLQDARRLSEIEAQVKQAREQKIQGGSKSQGEQCGGKPGSQGRQCTEGSRDPEPLHREDLKGLLIDTDSVFCQYPEMSVKPEFTKALYNGNPLQPEWAEGWKPEYKHTVLRIYDSQHVFIGIYRWEDKMQTVKPVKLFME